MERSRKPNTTFRINLLPNCEEYQFPSSADFNFKTTRTDTGNCSRLNKTGCVRSLYEEKFASLYYIERNFEMRWGRDSVFLGHNLNIN
ncbi:hypothetical protein Zmor_004602 [Zophobas morio]|uniref:Uncharacterized protein n=1 Tax=Zophobas morio TaxID=2755281 RepID=A0AA38IUM3_9CUCU|nr:hypothetical protein Zmor_004602 [Zophobas morio]